MAVRIAEEEEKEKKKQSHQFCMSPQLRIIYVLVVSTWCGMCVAFPLMGKLIYLRLYYGIETTLMVSDILKHFLSLSLLPAALPPHRKLYVYIFSSTLPIVGWSRVCTVRASLFVERSFIYRSINLWIISRCRCRFAEHENQRYFYTPHIHRCVRCLWL